MNKKLFSLLLFVMATFTAAFAQETVTVYDGTDGSTYVPVYGTWADAYNKVEIVMDAAELEDLAPGSTITGLTWYLKSVASGTWGNDRFRIFLNEVDATTISNFYGTDGATIVYEGELDPTQAEMSVEFSTPYVYGGGNLLIGVYEYENGTWKAATFYGVTTNGASVGGYSSTSLDAIAATQRNFVPKTTFTYTPGSGVVYNKPKNIQVEAGVNDAVVTWDAGNNETSWNVQYKKTADEEWTDFGNVTERRAELDALANGTPYQVQVQAVYADGFSGWAIANFQTKVCEDSEKGEVTYTLTDTYGDGWNGGGKLQILHHESGSLVAELVLPNTSSSYELEGSLMLCYGVDYDLYWVGGTYTYENGFVLTASDGSVIYEFVGTGSSGGATLSPGLLTTFQINQVTCPRPTNLAASDIVYNGAKITWTPGDEEQDAWEVIYAEGTPVANAIDMVPVAVTGEAKLELSTLSENTTYTAYVRGNCDENDKSNWSEGVTFTTPLQFPLPTELEVSDITTTTAKATWAGDAEKYNIRYRPAADKDATFSDDFENGMGKWTIYTDGEAPNTNGWYAFNLGNSEFEYDPLSGDYVASAWSWNNANYDADNWLVTPQVTFADNLSFWIATNSYYPDSYEVLLSTTGNAEEDFTVTLQAMEAAPNTGQWNEVNISLADYKGQTGYIAIHHVSENCNYLFIDDFSIYSDIEAGEWTVKNEVASGYVMGEDHDPALTPNTKYETQVQAVYTDGISQWTESVLFTTKDGLDMPTNLAVAEITDNSAKASWDGIQDSYNLRYRKAAKADVKFFEGFENGLDAWTLVDSDGDGINWMQFDPTNFSGGSGFPAYEGQYAAMSRSWQSDALTPDQWMISPEIEDLAGTLRYYIVDDGANYQETYRIYVCTTGSTDIEDFEPVTDDMLSPNSAEWTEVEVDLSAYAGQSGRIAFRHYNCTDRDFMLFDAIGIYANEVPAGEWITIEGVTSPYVMGAGENEEPLAPETDYEVQVQGIFNGAKALTEWTELVPFTTLAAPEPEPVITLDVEFGTYTEAQTVHVTVENMPEGGVVKYELIPSNTRAWETYDDATGIVVDESAALTVAVFDAEDNKLAEISGEYTIDPSTGISIVGIDSNDNEWYNLNGQKLNGKPTTPGIYINGNKKVIIK